MSEQGISICIFSVIVAVLAVVLVWLGEKQEKKEQKKNEDNKQSARGSEEGEIGDREGGGRRYVHLESGGKKLSRAVEKGTGKRKGRKAHGKAYGVDVGD